MSSIAEIIGFEYRKILYKKSTRIVLVALVVLILFAGCDTLLGNTYKEGVVVRSKYEEMQKNREAERKISGRVVDEALILEARDAFNQYLQKGPDSYEVFRPYHNLIYIVASAYTDDIFSDEFITKLNEENASNYGSDMKTYMKHIIQGNYSLTKGEKEILSTNINRIQTPFTFEYSGGYTKYVNMVYAIGIFMAFGIAICLAPMFSGEYSTKMDALILTSRYGKNKIIIAKLITGLTFSIVVTIIGLFIAFFEACLIFGTDGANTPIQFWITWSSVLFVYPLKCIEGVMILSLCTVFAAILVAAITMFLSARLKSSFSAIIISSILIFAPLFLYIPNNLRLLSALVNLLPVNMMAYTKVFSLHLFTIGNINILPYHFIPAFCVVVSSVLVVLAYQGFKKHQIT